MWYIVSVMVHFRTCFVIHRPLGVRCVRVNVSVDFARVWEFGGFSKVVKGFGLDLEDLDLILNRMCISGISLLSSDATLVCKFRK